MNLPRSLCAATFLLTLAAPLLAEAEGCEPLSLPQYEECAKLALAGAKQCRMKLGLPQSSLAQPDTPYAKQMLPADYIKLAECEEAVAAKTKNKAAAEEMIMFARDHRRYAKPDASIGMTAQQVVQETAWGAPKSVSRTVTASGTREQWAYGGGDYLYFEN